MAFKKAKKQESQSNVDWKEFNQHVHDVVQEVIEEEGGNLVCFVSLLVDSGTQPPIEEEREYDWEDTEQQNKLIKIGVGRQDGDKFYVKNRNVDSVIIAVDFPSILINYGKFFNEDGADDFKPYRHLVAGSWQGVAGYSSMSPASDGYSPLSMISKIAKATGAYAGKGKVPQDFDIGDILGKAFTMDVEVELSGDDDQYLNFKALSPSKKHKAVPVPEHDITPSAILLDGGNDEDELKQLNNAIIKRLQEAEEWDKSGLKKELEKLGKLSGGSSNSGSEDSDEKPKSKVTKPKKPTKVEQEPDEEPDDEENPFE